ncbi:hypothetical protein MIR68_011496 [Amoeboaphelidium protococcarum]|nr:hypothetical protein MIR68_011496 [Amoeboaphelidium protococcarum]
MALNNLNIQELQHLNTDNKQVICAVYAEQSYYIAVACDGSIDIMQLGVSGSGGRVIASVQLADDNASLICMEYLMDSDAIFLAFNTGELIHILLLQDENGDCGLEQVGVVDDGITCAKWSPTQDNLVITTLSESMMLFNSNYELLSDALLCDLNDQDASGQFVNVGWGSAQTQFKNKQAALQQKQQNFDGLAANDSKQTVISWRQDGEFFLISSIIQIAGSSNVNDSNNDDRGLGQQKKRIFRVFNRNGDLQASSERNAGRLTHAIDWKPSGSQIAAASDDERILLFERNGLLHREFSLVAPGRLCGITLLDGMEFHVDELCWSPDSSILAIRQVSKCRQYGYVELWTCANYQWQRKLILSDEHVDITSFSWLSELNGTALYTSASGGLSMIKIQSQICTNAQISVKNPMPILVVDGTTLHYTPLKFANVPPPMSLHQIALKSQIQSVRLSNSEVENQFTVLTVDKYLRVFNAYDRSMPVMQNVYSLSQIDGVVYDAIQLSESHVCVLVQQAQGIKVILLRLISDDLSVQTIKEWSFQSVRMINFQRAGQVLLGIQNTSSQPDQYLLVISDGSSASIDLPSDQIVFAYTVNNNHNDQLWVWLSAKNQLYIGEQTLKGVTSMAMHKDYLLYTTSSHDLKFVSLHQDLRAWTAESQHDKQTFDENVRRLERGALIASINPVGIEVVLQLPRGNLETVYPRALVLSQIREDLLHGRYQQAVVQCRKHRIDMNIICDYNFDQFVENVDQFVSQVNNVEHLNLFLSNLRNEDVTQTLYRGALSDKDSSIAVKSQSTQDKVNAVSALIRTAVEQLDAEKFFQVILTSFVVQNPPDIDSALIEIQKMVHNDQLQLAEDSIKYVALFVNINELYDCALGLYDFDLTVLVAEQSNKDPKEYLQFLKELQSLDTPYRWYKVDLYLKRYLKALGHLVAAGEEHHPELLEYIQKKSLYVEALQLISQDNTRQLLQQVYGLQGDYLRSKRQYQDAADAYKNAGDLDGFVDCCKDGLLWQELLVHLLQAEVDALMLQEIGHDLAEELKDRSRHEEAAKVYLDFCSDTNSAVLQYLAAHKWFDAMVLCGQNKLDDMMDTQVVNSVKSAFRIKQEEFGEIRLNFDRHLTRLSVVRQQKLDTLRLMDEQMMDELADDVGDIDLFSDIATTMTGTWNTASRRSTKSSVHSNITRMTKCTSRKKEERKKVSGKEGGAYEEEYLVMQIRQLMEKVDNDRLNVGSLRRALCTLNMPDKAEILNNRYEELARHLGENYRRVFDYKGVALNVLPKLYKAKIVKSIEDQEESADVQQLLQTLYTAPAKPQLSAGFPLSRANPKTI